jgi:flavin reductase (DIM6/NTAB) family NADH-FMN oxidoreductase RutF
MPELPGHEVFIGEVVEVYVSQDCMAGDQPDIKKVDPLMLGGRSYWSLGSVRGTAWNEGLPLIKR